jgi:hypothetical protein
MEVKLKEGFMLFSPNTKIFFQNLLKIFRTHNAIED